ncbi:MAG TPA: TRAM domain-containing protein, partial [Acidimicrobiia bacterium]|nr:TRAM domain-containing protein [Acidimicrobiia bacterium]
EFVPADVARERMRRLTERVEHHALRRHEARVGRVEQVLVDGPSKTDPAMLSGRTRQNKLAHFAPADPQAPPPPGAYADVRITAAAPHWLRGDHVATTSTPPRAKTHIPVTVV